LGPDLDSIYSSAKGSCSARMRWRTGIAHALALDALDEMGISPVTIAGTSMGDVIGGAYVAGIGGAPSGLIYCESWAIAPTS
jgi:hypothetical protein